MLDKEGYRPNVGIVLCNDIKQVLWARRIKHDGWQFPQGGVKADESPDDAMYRELREEIEFRIKQYSYCIMNNTKNYRDWLQEDYERRLRLRISQLFADRL